MNNRDNPKRVQFKFIGYSRDVQHDIYSCDCPNCGNSLYRFVDNDLVKSPDIQDLSELFQISMNIDDLESDIRYCPYCGQRVIWRGKEDA